MSYRVIDLMAEFTDRTTGARSVMAEIAADTAADLPANTAQLTYILGSFATVVDTGDKYKINSSGVWQLQPGSEWTNVYSKTEIDAIIQSVIDGELKRSDIYRGYQITANTDMNDDTLYGNYGTYYCSDGATAATLQNSPITSSGFVMLNFSTGNRVRLFLAVSANTPRMFIQARTGGTWRTIRQFAMLDEIPTYVPISLLSQIWENGTTSDATGDFNVPSTVRIRSQHYFSIPDNVTTFQVSAHYQQGFSVGVLLYAPYFYDANKNYLGNIEGTGWYGWTSSGNFRLIPNNAKFIRLILRYPDGSSISPSVFISGNISYT